MERFMVISCHNQPQSKNRHLLRGIFNCSTVRKSVPITKHVMLTLSCLSRAIHIPPRRAGIYWKAKTRVLAPPGDCDYLSMIMQLSVSYQARIIIMSLHRDHSMLPPITLLKHCWSGHNQKKKNQHSGKCIHILHLDLRCQVSECRTHGIARTTDLSPAVTTDHVILQFWL